jgi:toxin ParE1/3/4
MRLRYTLPALADLTSILDYIADRSPQGAAHIHTRIRAVTDLLLRYPLAGAVTDDPTIRRITTTPYPYLIFYEATDPVVRFCAMSRPRLFHCRRMPHPAAAPRMRRLRFTRPCVGHL